MPSRLLLRRLRLCQEIRHRHSIEIKHLGARQFSIAEAIEPKNLIVYALSCCTAPSLMPEDYDVIALGGDDSGIHFSLRFCRLQGLPGCPPPTRLRLYATKSSPVWKRSRPMDFKIRSKQSAKLCRIALLNRAENGKDGLAIFLLFAEYLPLLIFG